MDLLRSYYYAATKQELMFGIVAVEVFFSLPFLICSFVVAGTANAGFNCVLTGFLNIGLAAGSYYVIKNSKAPLAIGFLLGSSGMMALLNFMTAIYWGQLSGCKFIRGSIAGYSCSNRSAYGAVCAFAVFLFLTQLTFTVALNWWRSEFVIETGSYDDLPQASGHSVNFSYAAPPMPSPLHMPPQQMQQQPMQQQMHPPQNYVHPTGPSADL